MATMSKVLSEPLNEWAAKEAAKLPKRVRRLIDLAKHDLWNGPLYAEHARDLQDPADGPVVKWRGFDSAVEKIKEALERVHADEVWVDVQVGAVQVSEPQGYSYQDKNPDHDPEDPASEEYTTFEEEVNWEDFYRIGRRDVIAALVGEELVPYVL